MLPLYARKTTTLFLLLVFLISLFATSIPLSQTSKTADAAVPAARRVFDTQNDHTGPVVHSSGNYPAYCLDYGVPGPRETTYTRGEKFSRGADTTGRAISIAIDLGPKTLSGGTTINGISLSNLEWRMATQVAIHRLQGNELPYSTSSDYWRASTWIVNRALNSNTVQLSRYWRYLPPEDVNMQRMTIALGDPLTARVRVRKRSALDNRLLAGARFGMWTSRSAAAGGNTDSSSFVGQSISDSEGNTWWYRIPVGSTYYIRELAAPAGYVLNTTVLEANPITGNDSETERESLPSYTAGTVLNDARYGTRLNLQKIDKETGLAIASGGASLAGAEFEIRWLDPSKPGGWEVQTLVTDTEGRAEYLAGTNSGNNFKPGIPLGEFQIREVKPPEGYLINPEFSNWRTYKVEDPDSPEHPIEISLNNLIPRIAEPLIRGDIAIHKYGSLLDGQNAHQHDVMLPLEGIRFDIIDDMPANGDGKTNPRYGQIVGTLVTDRDGYASSRDLIPPQAQWAGKDYSSGFLEYGDYLLREDPESTPAGLRPIDDMRFSVSENGVERRYGLFNHEITAALSIVKRDAETQKVIPLAGTQFQLFDKDMNLMSFNINYPHSTEVSTFTTDETGQINIPEPLKYGSYFLKEVQAPEGYLLLEEPLAFTVDSSYSWSEPLIVCIDNYPAKGRVRIRKVDSATKAAVPDTVFELRAKGDIVTKDGSVRLRAGELADILRTNEEGIAESIELYLGSYELREIEANQGYLLTTQAFDLQLSYADQNTALVWGEIEIENEPISVSCQVDKSTLELPSAGFKSLPNEGNIDNSAQGSKELYRYDVDFRSTSNDWADEYVVIDYLEGVNADQIRIEELWTPVVWGDSNGLYHLWYQTNFSDETTLYSDSFAGRGDGYNPANPEKFMRFDNKGWKLWLEDASSTERQRLKVSELELEADEYITSLKLEFGRVEKGFTSRNSGTWLAEKDDPFYSEVLTGAKGLAPLSYLVYCPQPLEKFNPLSGEENIILNSASSHITRNITLLDDDKDEVQTRLVDSFIFESDSKLDENERSKDTTSDDDDGTRQKEEEEKSPPASKSDSGPSTGDQNRAGQLLFLALVALLAVCTIIAAMRTDMKKNTGVDSND